MKKQAHGIETLDQIGSRIETAKSHTREEIERAFMNGEVIWVLDTDSNGDDDVLIGGDRDDVIADILAHHEFKIPEFYYKTIREIYEGDNAEYDQYLKNNGWVIQEHEFGLTLCSPRTTAAELRNPDNSNEKLWDLMISIQDELREKYENIPENWTLEGFFKENACAFPLGDLAVCCDDVGFDRSEMHHRLGFILVADECNPDPDYAECFEAKWGKLIPGCINHFIGVCNNNVIAFYLSEDGTRYEIYSNSRWTPNSL